MEISIGTINENFQKEQNSTKKKLSGVMKTHLSNLDSSKFNKFVENESHLSDRFITYKEEFIDTKDNLFFKNNIWIKRKTFESRIDQTGGVYCFPYLYSLKVPIRSGGLFYSEKKFNDFKSLCEDLRKLEMVKKIEKEKDFKVSENFDDYEKYEMYVLRVKRTPEEFVNIASEINIDVTKHLISKEKQVFSYSISFTKKINGIYYDKIEKEAKAFENLINANMKDYVLAPSKIIYHLQCMDKKKVLDNLMVKNEKFHNFENTDVKELQRTLERQKMLSYLRAEKFYFENRVKWFLEGKCGEFIVVKQTKEKDKFIIDSSSKREFLFNSIRNGYFIRRLGYEYYNELKDMYKIEILDKNEVVSLNFQLDRIRFILNAIEVALKLKEEIKLKKDIEQLKVNTEYECIKGDNTVIKFMIEKKTKEEDFKSVKEKDQSMVKRLVNKIGFFEKAKQYESDKKYRGKWIVFDKREIREAHISRTDCLDYLDDNEEGYLKYIGDDSNISGNDICLLPCMERNGKVYFPYHKEELKVFTTSNEKNGIENKVKPLIISYINGDRLIVTLPFSGKKLTKSNKYTLGTCLVDTGSPVSIIQKEIFEVLEKCTENLYVGEKGVLPIIYNGEDERFEKLNLIGLDLLLRTGMEIKKGDGNSIFSFDSSKKKKIIQILKIIQKILKNCIKVLRRKKKKKERSFKK